jgi:hypothetical protein
MLQGVSYVQNSAVYIRNLIPGRMSIPSPASLAYRGGAKRLVSNDVEEEFSEVQRKQRTLDTLDTFATMHSWETNNPKCRG